MASEFGNLLREFRLRSGLTQKELEAKSHISEKTIRRHESGRHTNPSAHTARQLAEALGLSDDEKAGFTAAAARCRRTTSEEPTESPGSPAPPPPFAQELRLPHRLERLTEAAEVLAVEVRSRAGREYEHEVSGDFPPVTWRPVTNDESGSEPADHQSEFGEIAAFYDQLSHRRLVIVGKAGSGKTIATLRLALDLLRLRGRRGEADSIPVIFRISSWDPAQTAFRDWISAQLIGDYPHLAESLPGDLTMATALTEAHEILPILDGFDEIPASLRHAALRALDQIRMPFVLTSRPEEYGNAVGATEALSDAPIIQLETLTSDDWKNYVLPAAGTKPRQLATTVVNAIDTPFLITLARTIYRDTAGADSTELYDESRFPDRAAVERHLQANFIASRYATEFRTGRPEIRRDWPLDRVHRWLGYLAGQTRKTKTTDIAWWHIGGAMSLPSRAIIMGTAAALVVFLACLLLGVPLIVLLTGEPFMATLRLQSISAVLNGTEAGVAVALVYSLVRRHRAAAPGPSRIAARFGRAKPPAAVPTKRIRARTVRACLGGLAFGVAAGLARGLMGTPPALVLTYALAVGVVIAVAAAIVVALASWLESPAGGESGASHRGFLKANRDTALIQMSLAGLLGGLILAIGIDPLNHLLLEVFRHFAPQLTAGLSLPIEPPYMVAIGVTGGASAALAYGLSLTAWGQWIILGRLWLPLTGRLPWNLPTFLDDAYQRHVLRQPGPVYQFRHEHLHHHLANGGR